MATATVGVVSYECVANYNTAYLTITAHNEEQGTRTLVLDLQRANAVADEAEASLVRDILALGNAGDEYLVSATVAELRTLAGLAKRANATPTPLPVKAPTKEEMAAEINKAANHAAMMAQHDATKNSRGLNATERELNSLDRMAKTLTGDVYKLTYDIPVAKNNVCPSPCALLWSVGAFPASESDWVIRGADLNRPEVQEMIRVWVENSTGPNRVKHWLVRYHPDDLHIVRQQAVEALETRVREIKASITSNILAADERLSKAQQELDSREEPATERDRLLVDRARDNRVRSILKGAWEDLSAVVKAAETFEETDSVATLIDGLRQTIACQASSFNAAMQVKGSKPAPTA